MGKKQEKKLTQPQVAEGMTKRHLFAIALLSISIFLAYSNSLNGTWAMDDIVTNKPVGIKDIHDFIGFRKVAYITFLLNQSIAPFSPINYRLLNILIHILNTSLVYVLAYKTFLPILKGHGLQTKKQIYAIQRGVSFFLTPENQAFFGALISGIIFGLHPININAVAYIVQRMASLATLFVLLSLICYISAALSSNRLKAVLLYVLSGIFIVIGIFSKENAVMAIPLIFLYDYVFLSRFNRRFFIKKMLVIGVIGIVTIGLTSYFMRFHHILLDIARMLLNPNTPLTEKGWMAVDVYWTTLQHVLTEFRVVSRYIFLIFFPLPQFLVFDWWGFPISTGITEPITTMLSMILLSTLLVFSVWQIKRFPFLCFGILWYIIAISLESFFALGSDFYFEHRNYLPVSGLIIGIVGQIVFSVGAKMKEKMVWATAIVFCIVLGLLTFSRNFVWKDSITLWGDTLKKTSSNIRAIMAIGNTYLKVSDLDNAERYYKEVMKISSKDKRPHFLDESAYSLGMIYLFKGQLQQAKELIDKFDYSIESYKPRILKGFYKALNNDLEGALDDYEEIIGETRGIDSVVVLTLMGDAYRGKDLWDNAIEKYNNAIELDHTFAAAYYGIGAAYMGKREIEHASDYLNRALSIDPNHILALSDMADLMLIRKSRPEDALIYAERAVSKSPPFYQPYLTMGNVLIVLGKEKEAEVFYKKAVEHGMLDYMVPFSKARAYYIKGDAEKTNYYFSELQRYKDLPEKIQNIIKQHQ
jgi:tetratricopeptide (TPR) repeat protein